MTTPSSSRRPGGNNKEREDSPQIKSNLSGLKHSLHGTSYQLKLGIVICLANAKKALDPANGFRFEITAEDPTAGKFDDIVYSFSDGEKTGIIKIQVKHRLGSPAPYITPSEFTTGKDSNNPFAILKYFTSFCDRQQSTTDLEGFVLCTNSDLDDKAKNMWKIIEPAVTDNLAPSLDSYVSSLFDRIGGKCYQLDYDKIWASNGTFSNFYQLLRNSSKRARLARLLVDAIKSKKKITLNNSLYKEYRSCIIEIIDRNETSSNDMYGFKKEFLDSSYSRMPSYEAFRKEFEHQFRQEFKFAGSVWDQLKQIRVCVSHDFLSEETVTYFSSKSFPDDDVDELIKSFCDQFRLVCGTYNEQGLGDAIVDIWRSLHAEYDHMAIGESKGSLEEKVATESLFKTNFEWLIDPFAKPLDSKDFVKDLEKIENTLAQIKLKGISDKLRRKVVRSPFRIKADTLKDSGLYRQVENERFLQVEAYDDQFGATVLSDILDLNSKQSIFLEESDFSKDFEKEKNIISSLLDCRSCLIVICNGKGTVPVDILKNYEKQVFLIKKRSHVQSKRQTKSVKLSEFCVRDLTEESWNQFLGTTIPLCTTTILLSKTFKNNYREYSIEEVIRLLEWGKEMEKENDISKKYHEIESTYVHRPWVDSETIFEPENIEWNKDSDIRKRILESQQEGMSIHEISKSLKKDSDFRQIFGKVNNAQEEHELIVGSGSKKVLILLGEAGFGKSTNLTWMAWHLRKQNPSSWVVRCNLSDHCTSFKQFIQQQNNQAGEVIGKTEALRVLYKLICSSLQLQQEMVEKCLILSDEEAIFDEDLIEDLGLSLNNCLQLLVFKEKFNEGKLILLLDGFDEIAPLYKEVVLKFMSYFELFKGVEKLYLSSRPYGFKEQFQTALKDPSFFQLKPLSLKNKGLILFKLMKEKWNNRDNDDEKALRDSFKSLCIMMLCSLGDMSDIPLNLMMTVDILDEYVHHNGNVYINFSSKTFSRELLGAILKLSKGSYIVEEFLTVKIRYRLYGKNGADKNVVDKPEEMERFEKAIDEAKLLHGLVAVCEIYNHDQLEKLLSPNEIKEAMDYMEKIHEGIEKTGIIHSTPDRRISFIHRKFADYLATWWFVKRRKHWLKQGWMNISKHHSVYGEVAVKDLANLDSIISNSYPLHVAILDKNWKTVELLLSTSPKSLYERDDANRTPFHLIALYYDFEEGWPHFLPDAIETRIMCTKDNIFDWTALDSAFCWNKPQLVYYLLHHGALIDEKVLFEQVLDPGGKVIVHNAAKYATYVMRYLSRKSIEYELHDACKKMKQFCDKVVATLGIEASTDFCSIHYRYCKIGNGNDSSGRQIVKEIVAEDSTWMLESIIHRWADRKHFVRMLRNSYLNLESETETMFVLQYFMEKDPCILNDDYLWDCIVLSVTMNYKEKFKYFFDLYCSRTSKTVFQPCLIQCDSIDCSIQNDEASYLIDYVRNIIKNFVCDFQTNKCWSQLGMSAEVLVAENILSLLIICVATERPSMLRYMIESCKLNLCAGIVYSLAMITNHLLSKIRCNRAIKPDQAYGCLLNLASNISDVEANKMLRLAIVSQLFEFSKCLIERYKIDFHAVDELNGWNVCHLCISNQRSIWIDEIAMADHDTSGSNIDGENTDLFRYMLTKETSMDCFGIIDKKGRSILHLAMENGHRDIVEHIVARKLGVNHICDITILRVDAIPNITFCYRSIQEISKSVAEKWWHYKLICTLAKLIAKISLTNREESQGPNSGRLLLQEDAKILYQMAMKRRSLFLMYYLRCEFPSTVPPVIYDAYWLAYTSKSLRSSDYLDVTKWLLNSNEVDKHDNLYEVVEECDAERYDLTSVDLKELVKQVETVLSANRSVEEEGKLKLLALAVCLKCESMMRYLCKTLNVNIDWKVLIDIVEMAHRPYVYKQGSKDTDVCAFDKPDFVPIYKYLFECTSNLGEIDAEGRNVLHLAAQSGLGCMAKFLIKHNMINVTITNEQNGWNTFHYYVSCKSFWRCCYTENDWLLICMFKRVLGLKSNYLPPPSMMTESQKNKLKKLWFNSDEVRKSVIHVAFEAGNYLLIEYIVLHRLEIQSIYNHQITDSFECSRFRECYDELSQIASQLPFNAQYDILLHRLAKTIHRFSLKSMEHITGQGNGVDHNVEDACHTAIIYRSLVQMEQLIIAHKDQMNQALARSFSNELLSCMIECIRLNRISMFKVLVGHFRTWQGIQPRVKVEFGVEENDNIVEVTILEWKIKWCIICQFTEDVAMNRYYLSLFIWLVAYGRLSMTRYVVEMLQLEVNKSLIVLIMKVLEDLWDHNCKTATPVYEYLANRCEGKPNLLRLCTQAGCWTMFKYLIEKRKLDPNETDSENGWNVGHYCVSGPNVKSGYDVFAWLVDQYNLDCFGVYDRKGRNILHLALENGRTRDVKYIINQRLVPVSDKQPWYEFDLEKIEALIYEQHHTIKSLPEIKPQQNDQVIHDILETSVFYLANRIFANFVRMFTPDCRTDNEHNEKKNTKDMIGDSSVKMLENVNQKEVNEILFCGLISISFFDFAFTHKSIFFLAHFMASNPSLLPDEYLWKCAVYASLKNYNIEFKYFFDLYCSRFKINEFQPCSIHTDKAYYLIDYSQSEEIDEVYDCINNICWSKLGMPTEFIIEENILSLLIICVATVRPSMLRYMIESCKLNLCAGIVYSLAMITNHLLSKIRCKRAIKPDQAYGCLLDLASNISDVEANKMLRLAIVSQLFEFSKCLIERYKIDFQAVDELNGWNVCHLCVSNQHSLWVDEIAMADHDTRGPNIDGENTDLFRYMLTKETNMDCFGIIDKKGRSILHLAMENGHRGIVEHIVARKLGVYHICYITTLRVDTIPNITFCYRSIQEILKSVEEKWWHYIFICMLAKQIAKISLTNREESQGPNSGRLLLQEDAKILYQMAMKRRSLFLMYYLRCEFPSTVPPVIYDAYWLAYTSKSLRSSDYLDVTKWLLNSNEVDKHGNLYEVVEECDDEGYDLTSVDLKELVKQVETVLSANRSVEEEGKLKLLALAVCLKCESMMRNLCKTLNVNIDWKVLIDIVKMAHRPYVYKQGSKDTDVCAFDKPDFVPIYKYLFECTSNLGEIDAEGRNVLHLAALSGLGCMAKFLIKHNMVNVTITNVQNGWNTFHYYVSCKSLWKCCYTRNDWLLICMIKRVLGFKSNYLPPLSMMTESQKNKLKKLWFNSDEGRKSVIHVAFEAGNSSLIDYIVLHRLGIQSIYNHQITDSFECSRFRECYDELSQIVSQLPFKAQYDILLHRLAKTIHRFSPKSMEHITVKGNGVDFIVEDSRM